MVLTLLLVKVVLLGNALRYLRRRGRRMSCLGVDGWDGLMDVEIYLGFERLQLLYAVLGRRFDGVDFCREETAQGLNRAASECMAAWARLNQPK